MDASLLAAAGGLPASVRARQQGVAVGWTHRQPVRRSQPDLRLPADGGLRGGRSVVSVLPPGGGSYGLKAQATGEWRGASASRAIAGTQRLDRDRASRWDGCAGL